MNMPSQQNKGRPGGRARRRRNPQLSFRPSFPVSFPVSFRQALWRAFLPALLAALLLSACGQRQAPADPQVYQSRFLALGTLVDVNLWGVDEDLGARAVRVVEEELDRFHRQWHAWRPGPLAELNRRLAAGETVPVSSERLALLRRARDLSLRSGGLFDPAIGGLMRLWGFHNDDPPNGPPPPAAAIRDFLARRPTMEDLVLEAAPDGASGRVRSTNPALQLDLGGFAKGYAVDRAVERLLALGVRNAIVNAGGDLRAVGSHGDRPWRIGIRDPRGPGIIAALETRGDESVFTSGNYERFFEYQGVRYHHILDPRTGHPAAGTLSVTVIHRDAATADAAATALFVAGPQGWRQVARQMGIEQVMLIDEDGRIHVTPSMNQRLIFQSEPLPEVIETPL